MKSKRKTMFSFSQMTHTPPPPIEHFICLVIEGEILPDRSIFHYCPNLDCLFWRELTLKTDLVVELFLMGSKVNMNLIHPSLGNSPNPKLNKEGGRKVDPFIPKLMFKKFCLSFYATAL